MPLQHHQELTVDCACLIHGDKYSWDYVEKLYSMLQRNFSYPIKLHVFTEAEREVPAHMIKHSLDSWPAANGPKRAWWYKMQMFNPVHVPGRLLYFDLDVLIVDNLDWMLGLSSNHFWTIKDFRSLWRANWTGINSSVMFWDTQKFQHIWKKFSQSDMKKIMDQYPGDQDYISVMIDLVDRRFIDPTAVQSWRWQVDNGGLDMKTRTHRRPGAGAVVTPGLKIVIFHGRPKPDKIHDDFVVKHWR
jgi:hypothetical protein